MKAFVEWDCLRVRSFSYQNFLTTLEVFQVVIITPFVLSPSGHSSRTHPSPAVLQVRDGSHCRPEVVSKTFGFISSPRLYPNQPSFDEWSVSPFDFDGVYT